MSSSKSGNVPSELVLTEKYDKLLERVVLNAGYGLVFGLAASLVLARGRTSRVALSFFGMGAGVGVAFERSSADFKKW